MSAAPQMQKEPKKLPPPDVRDGGTLFSRLRYYLMPFDSRYEDLPRGDWRLNVLRDLTAGLIVAMVAIPLAMGFAMASGLRPEQGIVGGAVAGAVGALFGGSKYQVYGPTAAYIPVIGAVMLKYDHSMLVLASLLAGGLLMLSGVFRLGRIVQKVPHSIVVGFTIGIAFTIAMSQIGEILGLKAKMGYGLLDKISVIATNLSQINYWAIFLGLATFLLTKYGLKISPFLPAPLIAIGVTTVAAATVLKDGGFSLVKDKFGSIPTDFWVTTGPRAMEFTPAFLMDLGYFVVAIYIVAAIESLLCSRMADRLAGNDRTPFNPNKELWGQGMVNMIVPLVNGFPHTGALARTATNIRLGAVSPLAGIFKCVLKLIMAAYLATYLEMVPMACIGGILLYVASSMVKPAEVREVLAMNRFQIFLMGYTALTVSVTDFLTGVMSAIAIWVIAGRWFEAKAGKPVGTPGDEPAFGD